MSKFPSRCISRRILCVSERRFQVAITLGLLICFSILWFDLMIVLAYAEAEETLV
nr:MAG TPA: hypothetical protein [Caudoviricetes sp.]DAV70710.1 MAG TPA: hypothetical protein [Caudoviricetes sp.]